MKHLYVVTHPEATHHLEHRVGGWHDSALTQRGREQAARIAARLREVIPHGAMVELHTSDLRRCLMTAAPIALAFDVVPHATADLREISYGAAEGQPQAWLDDRFILPPCEGNRLDHDFGIAGAETRRQCGERVYPAVERIILSPAPYQIIVTHGFTLTMVVAAWIGMPLEAAGQIAVPGTSGGITHLMQDDRFCNRAIIHVNDTSHLI
ncbi:MAG: histidine phosphatase family protein [Thermomicrobiales bacterium]